MKRAAALITKSRVSGAKYPARSNMQDYKDILAEILIDEKALQKRVKELGSQISHDYEGQDLLLICILRGGLVFLVDLMRHITIPHALDCMALSSYGVGGRASSGNIRMSLDLQTNIENKNVLLVEDIVDSGYTLFHVLEMLQTRRPNTLKVCALLDKEERREIFVPIHYRGFTIPNKFVFGYGLDLDEYYRNLPFVAVVDLEKYKPARPVP
jgi:hypoxanthine phosphoribosyltransferase